MALVWVAGLSALAWSWRRGLLVFEEADIDVPDEVCGLRSTEIAWLNVRRHTVGWTAFFFGVFLIAAVINLPLWARLGMALALGVYYGTIRINNENENDGKSRAPLFSESFDGVWYPAVACLEWIGYLGVLVFGAKLVGELLS